MNHESSFMALPHLVDKNVPGPCDELGSCANARFVRCSAWISVAQWKQKRENCIKTDE